MTLLLRLARRVDALNRAVGRAASWLALAMVLIGAFNALARYFDRAVVGWLSSENVLSRYAPAIGRFLERVVGDGLSSNAYVELQWYLFSLVFLLGAPHALRAGAHVRVDVLYGRLGLRGKAWIDLVGGIVFLIPFCLFALWISWPSVRDSWAIREGSPDPSGLARYPIKSVIPVAFGLLLLQGLSETIKRAALLRGRSPEEVGLEEAREVRSAVSEGQP